MREFIYSFTRSSVDPTKLSLTVKGILVAIIPVACMLFGIDVRDAETFSEALVQLTFDTATVASTLMTVWGLARKVYNARWNHPDSGTM